MKRSMIFITVIMLFATLLCAGITAACQNAVFYTLAITFGTTFYHFAMRLLVGAVVDKAVQGGLDYRRKWFREKKWEKGLFKAIRIKTWKNHIPTFAPAQFDVQALSMEEIVKSTCRAEVVHEMIMVLSFVPIVFAVWFEELAVFVITSVIAALVDLVFVLLQRYNRPRLVKILERERKRGNT